MDMFRKRVIRKPYKPLSEKDKKNAQRSSREDINYSVNDDNTVGLSRNTGNEFGNTPALSNGSCDAEEDEDVDLMIHEVKRRLKDLRRNNHMVLIPEEGSCSEEEDEEADGAGESRGVPCRDFEDEGRKQWCRFYDKYCQRMFFFHCMIARQLKDTDSPILPSLPRSSSRRLQSPFQCLPLKQNEEPEAEMERLHHPQNMAYQDLETAYVSHICLTWEALHHQYTYLHEKIIHLPEHETCYYNRVSEQFQQFQVLLQRYIENEPFEQGSRPEIYARARSLLPKLLQIPSIAGLEQEDGYEDDRSTLTMSPINLIQIIESAILTYDAFLDMDKLKYNSTFNWLGGQNQIATHLQLIQSSLEKKKAKLKELCRKRRRWKKGSWPVANKEVYLLFGLIDIKLVSRVLRMERISKAQLIWCEEKMKKLDLSGSELHRDSSPTLFPCDK